MVTELNGSMFSKYVSPPGEYSTWKKEMQMWEIATCVEQAKQALTVFLSQKGKAREAVLELNIVALNSEDGMEKVYEKPDTLFLEDINQFAFLAYETFEGYLSRQSDTSIEDFFTNFGWNAANLKDFDILLPEPVLAFRALESVNLTLENERLIKATISELTRSSMSGQSWKIMHKQSSDASSPNTLPMAVLVKNKVDVIAYVENNQTDLSEVYYGHSSDRCDSCFNGWRGKINHGGRRHNNNNKTHSTNKKTKINPQGPESNTTVCFKCGCKFHWF